MVRGASRATGASEGAPCDCAAGSSSSDVRRRRIVAPLAVERQKHEAEHVGRRQQRRQDADDPENLVAVRERLEEDLVLAEEAGEPGTPAMASEPIRNVQ